MFLFFSFLYVWLCVFLPYVTAQSYYLHCTVLLEQHITLTLFIYIYLSCMEHLGVQKYMRYYKLLSTSTIVTYQLPRRRIFLGDAYTEIAMKFALRIYDFIEQKSAYSFLNCPDPSDFNEFFFHPPTLSHFSIKT